MSGTTPALKALKIVSGIPASDGAGVRLNRIMGTPELGMLDPFLLLDEFKSDKPDDYIAGFPAHPHRGFETVTYMLAGKIRHKDNAGHEGVIEPGGVQWMTAGRGIIHSEMPEQHDGMLWGFQLWINLPARLKMCEPHYQEFDDDHIPKEIRDGNIVVRIISGETSMETAGPVENTATNPVYLNLILPPDTVFTEPVNENHNTFIYVYTGSVLIGHPDNADHVESGQLAVLGGGQMLNIQSSSTGAKCLFLSAQPLNEPVARHGPFVMNNTEEIDQAIKDFQKENFSI